MVMFSCNRCSKGLKKKDVFNHSFQCGGPKNINVTCIDCLKDFKANEYDSHTSCVTEEVRYGGKGVVAKETGKKQNQWLGIVRQVLEVNQSLRHPVKKFLQSIQHMENIPRSKNKFDNWAYSAMHIKDTSFLDEVFEILQIEFKKSSETNKSKEKPQNATNDASDLQNAETVASVGAQEEVEKVEENACEKEVENGETKENGVTADKKKKKKKNKEVVADDVVLEELENVSNGLAVEKETEECEKPKKKKKHSVQTEEELVDSATPIEQDDGVVPDTTKECAELSKKERKLKKKKAKFEAELKEIENCTKEEAMDDGAVEEEAQKTKKSKKRKLVDESNVVKPDEERDDEKDKKRQKVDGDQTNGDGDDECPAKVAAVSPAKGAAGSPLKKQKFDWHQMIVDVLMKSKDDEVSVKKVTKKVINEYISTYGDKGIHEKLNAKMTKKLKTCPGIRVLKDKVKLVKNEA